MPVEQREGLADVNGTRLCLDAIGVPVLAAILELAAHVPR
jgi:hypothetical protein